MDENVITHQEFVDRYGSGGLTVMVSKWRAGDFIMSSYANRRYKAAHVFWTCLGVIVAIPLSIVLLFFRWYIAPISFVVGLIIVSAARRTAGQFVMQNMLESEDFWDYVLVHGGAEMLDEDGKELHSAFLDRMSKRFGRGEQG